MSYLLTDMWDSEKFLYPWPPPELQKIYKPFRVSDLQSAIHSTPVRKAVFIQVNQDYLETGTGFDWLGQILVKLFFVLFWGFFKISAPEVILSLQREKREKEERREREREKEERREKWEERREEVRREINSNIQMLYILFKICLYLHIYTFMFILLISL